MQMLPARIQIAGRAAVDFQLADEPGDRLYFVLGVRKCGSSIMNSMVESLARINHRTYLDVGGKFFEASIPEDEWRIDPALHTLLAPGNLFGGFRSMPLTFASTEGYRNARKILMVRDPRDALVSEYFSIAYSHSLPAETQGLAEGAREEMLADRERAQALHISDFVQSRAPSMNRTMMEYADTFADPQTRLFRYEEVILDKRPWLAAMAGHFGWDGGTPAFIDGMMGWADKVPSTEDPRAFVRKVVPGDHTEKLSAATIEALNQVLAPSLRLFGYS